jgi:alkyl hydroperoxide reductase subunit AhpF
MTKSRNYGNQFEFDANINVKNPMCVPNTLNHMNEVCNGRCTLQIIYHNRATGRAAKTLEVFNG